MHEYLGWACSIYEYVVFFLLRWFMTNYAEEHVFEWNKLYVMMTCTIIFK